jgi:hypothetical protein
LTAKGRNLGIASTILWAFILVGRLRLHHFLSPWFFFRH